MDAITHLTIELGYVYLTLTCTANMSDTFIGKSSQYTRVDQGHETVMIGYLRIFFSIERTYLARI